jgi:sterol desaturase/sphingolipid hydroxylase (fatty acid hydroxylase superfamily)
MMQDVTDPQRRALRWMAMRNYIALAIPVFFVMIGAELAVARAKRAKLYRLGDAVTDLSCGIQQQVLLIFERGLQVAIFTWAYQHRVATLPPWADWALAWVGVDFLYYWWHRLSHEVNFLWAAHVVHHQSEDYNLAVALRQSVLTSWTTLPFYLPLSLVGVSLPAFATAVSFSTLYQFWIHTELVGKVKGPVDWILNLPSHHRVHHAINPQYLDKNYGAISIIWDRIFGTYAEEIEPCVYGTTKPLASFNAVWAQLHYWPEMASMAARARGIDKLKVWFASPAWKPRGQEVGPPKPVHRDAFVKYEAPLTKGRAAYVVLHYAILVALTFALVMWEAQIPRTVLVLGALTVLGTVLAIGAIVEGKKWAVPAEVARLGLGLATAVVFLKS